MLSCLHLGESSFVYHMNNVWYKSKTLESVQKSDELDNQTTQCGDESGKNVEPYR